MSNREPLPPHALVVVAHPDEGSFNHALAYAVHQVFLERGFSSVLRDLYADDFDPVLTATEARGVPASDPLLRAYTDLLIQADILAVIHPNYWGAPPAIMKGWMDRVFSQGAAYAFEKGVDQGDTPKGLLKTRAALVLNTSNTNVERERLVFGDPLERIWRDCLLNYCGITHIKRHVFGIVAASTAAERATWLKQAKEFAREITQR